MPTFKRYTGRKSARAIGRKGRQRSARIRRCFPKSKYDILEGRRLLAGDLHLASQVSPVLDQVTSFATHDLLEGDDEPRRRVVSEDGRYVVFESTADDLVSNDNNSRSDVFRIDRQLDIVELVSVNVSGLSGSNTSRDPVISADGTRVAFVSSAVDLVAGGTSGNEIFVRDFTTATTELVSVEQDGLDNSGGFSSGPVISADGNVVAFLSSNSDLTSNTDFSTDLFVRDLADSTTTMVNVSVSDTSGNGNVNSYRYSISDDGNVIAYESSGTNLINVATSGTNIFAYNLADSSTTLVSANLAGTGTHTGGGSAAEPVISGDGDIVVFQSTFQDLVTGQTDGANRLDVFAYKISSDTMTMLSFEADGTDGASTAEEPVISRDGSTVAFFSTSANLVTGFTDTNGTNDLFAYQFDDNTATSGTLSLISVRNDGMGTGNTASFNAMVSDDGNTIMFSSSANNLVSFATNGSRGVFARDLSAGVTTLVSTNQFGTDKGNSSIEFSSLSGDGSTVAFESNANDHVAGDFNRRLDIFASSTSPGALPELVSAVLPSQASSTPNFSSSFAGSSERKQAISADGRYVVFESRAANIVPDDNNGTFNSSATDVFRYDTVTNTVELVSVNRDGTGTGNGTSSNGVISADGTKVAFQSTSTDLVDEPVRATQVYVRDFITGTTSLVSVTRDGDGEDGSATFPRISADGSTVAFFSSSDELLSDPTFPTFSIQIYARNLVDQSTTLVTVNADGDASSNGNHLNLPMAISDDGSVIAFQSTASTLSPLDTDNSTDIYARDLVNATTTLVSRNFAGNGPGDRNPSDPAISGDGSTVVFTSNSTDLVDPALFVSDTGSDIYAMNLVTGETSLVSVNILGNGSSNSSSLDADVNYDGSIVVFEGTGNNLVSGIQGAHIYRRNIVSGVTDLVSAPLSGSVSATDPQVSDDGNIIAFDAFGAFISQTSLSAEIFVRNMSGESTRLVSMSLSGGGGNMDSRLPIISADGLSVAFIAFDTNLVENDSNISEDVFVTTSLFEPPTIAQQTFEAAEDDLGIDALGMVVASGIESAVTYAITGGDSSLFAIDAGTGELFVAPGAMLDFESAQSHTIEVAVTDDFGLTDSALITINVTDVNEAPAIPVPGLDDRSVDEDNTLTIPAADLQALLGGQLDQDAADPNSALAGTLVIVDEDSIVVFNDSIDFVNFADVNFTPPLNYFGNLTATITVTDTGGKFDTSTFNILVNEVNDNPVAADDTFVTDEDTTVTFDILANDSDVDGSLDPTQLTISSDPANGNVSIDPVTGEATYTPSSNFNGSDSFTYTVLDDDGGESNIATVNITVNDVNDAPLALNDSETTDEDTAVIIDILSNDADIDGTLDVGNIFVGSPSNGSVLVNSSAGTVTYLPDPDFNGADSFTYIVMDDDGAFSNSATVSIAVNAINDAPILDPVGDQEVQEGSELTFIATATDVESDGLLFSLTGLVPSGATIDPTGGQFSWTPSESDGPGVYTFDIVATDDGVGLLADSETISVTVTERNTAPIVSGPVSLSSIVEDNSTGIAEGQLLANATDSDLPTQSLGVLNLFSDSGTLIPLAQGTWGFVPASDFNGIVTFTYEISDGIEVTPASATLEVIAENDAPIANDATFTIDEDDVAGAVVGSVTSSDVDGPDPEFSIIDGNVGNVFSIDGASGELTVAGPLDFETTSTYTLTVEVSDGDLSDTATVTINVDNVNEAPIIAFENVLGSLAENTDTSSRIKVADIVITDDALGTNNLELSGSDAALFEIDDLELFLISGANLDFETNPELGVTVTVSDGENPIDNESLILAITDVAEAGPRIVAVRVNSTAWQDNFRDFVDGGAGGSELGYPIPTDNAQLDILPWININQILVTFDADVGDSLEASDLTLNVSAGVNGDGTTASIPVAVSSPFEWIWDPTSMTGTAVFTLNQSIEPGRIDLQIASASVADDVGNMLDGEWTNGQTGPASGDGTAGGDFSFRINVLPGDVIEPSNEIVTTDDALEILNNAGLLLGDTAINYDARLDLNGDTVVNSLDSQEAVKRNSSRLNVSGSLSGFNVDFREIAFDASVKENEFALRQGVSLPIPPVQLELSGAHATSRSTLPTIDASQARELAVLHRFNERKSADCDVDRDSVFASLQMTVGRDFL